MYICLHILTTKLLEHKYVHIFLHTLIITLIELQICAYTVYFYILTITLL